MTTILSKIHKLLDLAEEVGEKQLRDDVAALLIKCCERPTIPIYRDYVYGRRMPVPLSLDWLYQDLDSFEAFHGREPDALLVSTRQRDMIGDLLRTVGGPPTYFNGIPLRVIAHHREGGGITG